jgi:hypothetical protein
MPERRYSEEEVAAIFANAARPADAAPRRIGPSSGLTLSELQDIGREVGLSEADVARAAVALAARPSVGTGRYLGVPIAVARVVDLPRAPNDAEWEQLVVDLRTTFRARGHLSTHGSLREWWNGNLRALIEPTGTGYQLRLETMKESARNTMVGGLAMMGLGAAVLVLDALSGAAVLPAVGLLSVTGFGMFGAAAARVPSWARRRQAEFDAIATRLLSALQKENAAGE